MPTVGLQVAEWGMWSSRWTFYENSKNTISSKLSGVPLSICQLISSQKIYLNLHLIITQLHSVVKMSTTKFEVGESVRNHFKACSQQASFALQHPHKHCTVNSTALLHVTQWNQNTPCHSQSNQVHHKNHWCSQCSHSSCIAQTALDQNCMELHQELHGTAQNGTPKPFIHWRTAQNCMCTTLSSTASTAWRCINKKDNNCIKIKEESHHQLTIHTHLHSHSKIKTTSVVQKHSKCL